VAIQRRSACARHSCESGNPVPLASNDTPDRKSNAFTGLRPARPFSRRKRTQNALRRARAGAAPAAPIRCASWQPQAGAELARPCALNTGAYSLRLPAMLAALYGALSHSVRASMRYMPAFPSHPTALWLHERARRSDQAPKARIRQQGQSRRGGAHTRTMSRGMFMENRQNGLVQTVLIRLSSMPTVIVLRHCPNLNVGWW
jgi:hypothetical protein